MAFGTGPILKITFTMTAPRSFDMNTASALYGHRALVMASASQRV
jgi:hypothetical protein